MPRKPRNTDHSAIRLVTIRTDQAQLLLKPGEDLNEIVGGIIAKYQEVFSIVIYAYAVLGNHYHLVVKAPLQNLWRFEQAVNFELAKRVNRLRSRSGHFWGRRYDDLQIVTESDALEAVLYVILNPVHHGLVTHPSHWPGLISYWQLLDGKDRQFTYFNCTSYSKALKRGEVTGEIVKRRDFESMHPLKITMLPQLEQMTEELRKSFLIGAVEERCAQIQSRRKDNQQGFLGRKTIMRQSPLAVPKQVKHSPRPLCYTKSPIARREFLKNYFPWLESYIEASRRFRAGDWHVSFPPFSLRPPLQYSTAL